MIHHHIDQGRMAVGLPESIHLELFDLLHRRTLDRWHSMNANEFTIRLKEIAPSKVLLLDCDYGADEADRFIKSFECRRRSQPIGIESNGDSMLELLDKWDISHVEIGPICFHAEPEKFDGHLEIGTIEGDRLVYRPDAKDYVLLDSQNLEHVMCDAAPNGDSLLDGLIQIADYFAKTAIDEIDIDDEDTGAKTKNECITAFGGSKYESFCTTALGF